MLHQTRILLLLLIGINLLPLPYSSLFAQQQVAITGYSTNSNGQVQLEVSSSADHYYILRVKNHIDSNFTLATSMTLGQNGTTTITESLKAYPESHYQVIEYDLNVPFDTDGDGLNDVLEFNNRPLQNPLNSPNSMLPNNGLVNLNSLADFQSLSVSSNSAPWLTFLDDKEFTKFIIVDFESNDPKVYFMNSVTYNLHEEFASFLGVNHLAPTIKKGHLIYYPNVISSNGTLGCFAFNFSNNESYPFQIVQRTHELLALNMTYLTNNLSYLVSENIETTFQADIGDYLGSRIQLLYESDIYSSVNYWGLNQAEGYGYFRQMTLSETPGGRDIVLYDALPNSLPRVGGIITSFIQTPLSHVNLRAIHDNVPNAFIRDPLLNDSISALLNHYIYFKTNQSDFVIREATLEEVNEWYSSNRPENELVPPLNLDYRKIKPLPEITFDMYDGFGAKVANVATMHSFGFPEGTIPNGFGIPFYYYQEFMKYNHFFDAIKTLLSDEDFIANRDIREIKLEELRDKINEGQMPGWMINDLLKMQQSFPVGTSIRCRSSTNNEDLPGFSGAGLYDSYTHHLDEGLISKSIRQVYASLWNLRAFEERDFYKVNHFYASMGVLCHPNFSNEKVNGVGVSADPIYNTENTFYLNSQVGEELITNPTGDEAPEELLLLRYPTPQENYSVIRYSSFVSNDSLLMTQDQLNVLREYLGVIHDEFAVLYHAEGNPTFAMDIEYKINSENQLSIKQARPWVSYKPNSTDVANKVDCEFLLFPNPAKEYINVKCEGCENALVRITDLTGQVVLEKQVNQSGSALTHIRIEDLPSGLYFINGFFGDERCGSVKFIKP